MAVRDALGKYHGGRIIPEAPPKGESQSNGHVEEAGKTIREFAVVMKEQLEDKADVKLDSADNIVQWMIRWAAMMVSPWARMAVRDMSDGVDGSAESQWCPSEKRCGTKS